LVEVSVALNHDLELATAELADAAGMPGAQRDHQRFARNSERVGHREDALDFRQSNRLEQDASCACRNPSLHTAPLA